MFGKGISAVIDRIPRLTDLEPTEVRRLLSTAYLEVVTLRSSGDFVTEHDGGFTGDYLRRLANALETHAVFCGEAGLESRRASAFVAAEALALLADLGEQVDTKFEGEPVPERLSSYRLSDTKTYSRVEAALLYLAAGFDPNAATIIGKVPKRQEDDPVERLPECAEWALDVLSAFCALQISLKLPTPPSRITEEELTVDLHNSVRAGLFRELGKNAHSCLRWFAGGRGNSEEISKRFEAIAEAIAITEVARYAEIHHLARLLRCAFDSVKERTLRNVPAPNEAMADEFDRYLLSRSQTGRPLLWPVAMEYVKTCLPGPNKHAVVTVPTGSGKSFVGELAIANGARLGWGLYLVPTNALANQVQGELERALEPLGITVQAFLGMDEYTILEEERIKEDLLATAVVMTPEKCALALRLSPKAFETCRVVVFDECHLLTDEHRGVIAELVLSHILALAPSCRVLLMSAMVSNPEDLADWLEAATDTECEVIKSPWRPTLTSRGVVGIARQQCRRELNAARQRLERRPPSRKKESFEAPHVIVANLQGVWANDDADDYSMIRLPTSTKLKVKRDGKVVTEGWANKTLHKVVVHLAERKISVLGFLPGSKHFPFSVGAKVAIETKKWMLWSHSELVQALLEIARDELGAETVVGELLNSGVAVHSAALLDSERKASELAFSDKSVPVMLATGTLAQGLNLPAEAVVIGGTSIGDPREAATPEGLRRTKAQLLNAIGRAGRAGVANHGVGLVITNHPLFFTCPPETAFVRQEADFLSEEEDSTVVESRLNVFVNKVLGGHIDFSNANVDELAALSYLAMDSDSPIEMRSILARTYAIRHRFLKTQTNYADTVANNLVVLSDDFLVEQGAPKWITAVAYRTGLSFFMALRLAQALDRVAASGSQTSPETIMGWLQLLFRALRLLPPLRAREILGREVRSEGLAALWDPSVSGDNPEWEPQERWTDAWAVLETAANMYCTGEQLADLAKLLFSQVAHIDSGRSSGSKPIPRVIGFLGIFDRLSRAAGAVLAIHELAERYGDGSDTSWRFPISDKGRRALANLSLALRFGCGDISTLAWYRFGVRYRRPAMFLSQQFPLPDSVVNDQQAREWILNTRSTWLRSDFEQEEHAVLRATRIWLSR